MSAQTLLDEWRERDESAAGSMFAGPLPEKEVEDSEEAREYPASPYAEAHKRALESEPDMRQRAAQGDPIAGMWARDWPADCCQGCGHALSRPFRRVFGDNANVLDVCPWCVDEGDEPNWAAFSSVVGGDLI